MVIRRTSHTVYDTQYHVVWSPKYRRDVLRGDVQQRVKELFADIALQYDIMIDEMEDGYFVRTVGDKVTAEIIRRYIQYHQGEKAVAQQLNLFD